MASTSSTLTSNLSDLDSETEDIYNTPPKKKQRTVSLRKFRPEWKMMDEFKGWLASVPGNDTVFKCMACGSIHGIKGGKSELDTHTRSMKHQRNITKIKNTASVKAAFAHLNENQNKKINHNKRVQESEIKLAIFMAENNIAISVVDSLLPLIKQVAKDPNIVKDMTLCRTKCSKILRNVVAEVETESLNEILTACKFSVLIDESTDVSSDKYLCVLARFVCQKSGQIKTMVVDMVQLNALNCSAESMYVSFRESLASKSIPLRNIIGLASDGANVMLGGHNSFQTRLSEDTDVLVILKCICHSSALIVSKACKDIPNVEDLLRALSSYMAHSSKRCAELAEMQEYFGVQRHKILKISGTRWLSMGQCVNRVLENWNVLVHFFLTASLDNLKQTAFIRESLNCPEIKAYFLFLKYILAYFNNFNELFQSNKVLIHCLAKESRRLFNILAQNFLKELDYKINCKNPRNFLGLGEIYLGPECELFISDLEIESRDRIKKKCLKFYITALQEIQDRLPLTDELFLKMEFLNPENALSSNSNRPPHLKCLNILTSKFSNLLEDKNNVAIEWRSLSYQFDDLEKETLKKLSVEEFWFRVTNLKNFDDKYLFKNISQVANFVLALPHSNAESERIFSIMNDVKTKKRNKMEKGTLNAITVIRSHNVHAIDYKVTDVHHNKMNSKHLYQ